MNKTEISTIKSVMVIGLGLIGGSIAMAIKDANSAIEIVGVAPRSSTILEAQKSGIINYGFEASDPALDKLLQNNKVDLIILSMPPAYAQDYLLRISKNGFRGIITDTVSTKTQICEIADHVLLDPSMFVPGHPMAGREVNGLAGATHGLFAGKYWILCPNAKTNYESFLALHSLVVSLGARCITIPREMHDKMVALISHVPHMVASALVELAASHTNQSDELFRIAAGGFRDSTRIAAGSPELWSDIAMSNRDQIASGLREIIQILTDVEKMIENGDEDSLKEFLSHTSDIRRRIPAAWSASSKRLLGLQISVRNYPGAIAEVTAIAGRMSCNIQSIDIEHITDNNAILELVLTDEGNQQGLLDALKTGGFSIVSNGYTEVQP